MSGTIELDRDGKTLLIGFPYREDLVDVVRNMPGRRWDRGKKQWKVPVTHAELVVTTFMAHGFEVSSEVSSILAGTGGGSIDEPAATETESTEEPETDKTPGLTISQLNERAKSALRSAFPKTVKVVGEVVDYDKNQGRAHLFFTLAEKDATGQRAKATVSAALFERTASRVLPAIEKQGLTLRDGIEIMVEARVDLYPANGRFQLIVEDIHPEFTLGKLALSRDQVLAELRSAGVHELNRELAMPVPSLRIGVLTSPTSDGWNDFLRELEAAEIAFDVSLYPIHVQGDRLKPTMLTGLNWFEQHADHFDALCIVRGGGSRSDLAWFDDRDVAFAVARHPLKVICGIGHERDRSVLDEITTSQKTPTAVAAYLVGQVEAAKKKLHDHARALHDQALDTLQVGREQLTEFAHGLRRLVHGRMIHERARLQSFADRATATTTQALRRANLALDGQVDRLRRATRGKLERESTRIDNWTTRQRLLDPARVLERGYTMVRDARGSIVKSVGKLKTDQQIEVTFRDGRAVTKIEDIQPNPKPEA